MSKNIVEKNFKLSADFNDYLVAHPEVFDNVPEDSCIIFTEGKKESAFNKYNFEQAKEMFKKGLSCFIAEKSKRKWSLRPMKVQD